MKILLCNRAERPGSAWQGELQAALPGVQIDAWQPGMAAEYEWALVWNPPQQLFDEQQQLKVAFNLGAGVDKLLSLRLPPALQVLRLQDAGMAVQMAEYVCHALIDFFRQLGVYRAQQRQGLWQAHAARERSEYPVGILGLGVLGTRVAQAVQAFDFPVRGWSRTPRAVAGVRCFAGAGELDAFLAASRVLVCLLPLTPTTRGLVDRTRLRRLQPGGCLINIARGGLVVEDDLRRVLDDGHLAAAVLDVMAQEPLPAGHWLWSPPRVTLTPHISAMTGRREAVAQVAQAVQAGQRGEALPGLVDRARGY